MTAREASRGERSTTKAPAPRPTAWWLAMLRKRAERMYDEKLHLDVPIEWSSEAERVAAVAFFNAAFRAEESGLFQAHQLADEVATWDPDLGEVLRLYGNEEGWHRELLTEFLGYLGGEIKPMGRVTGTFYKLYGMAKRIETIVLVNLMFETIGSTTYRLALRRAKHPAVRQMLTILTRDESFHVPLNVHFLRQALRHADDVSARSGGGGVSRLRMQVVHHLLFAALCASAYASRRRAGRFDGIPFAELSRAYAEQLGKLFLHERDLSLRPPKLLLRLFGLDEAELAASVDGPSAVSAEAAEAAVDRDAVRVTAL
ncbi:MAG: ferritin-like domain-containing protein [Polyangiaceae bacterium]